MKLLTKNTDYAVRALMLLSFSSAEYVSVRKLAQEQKMPYPFLRSLVQDLVANQIVETKEGKLGGVKLVKQPSQITLEDLSVIFQGEIAVSECMIKDKVCGNSGNCVLQTRLGAVEQTLKSELKKITIQTLLDDLTNSLNL